MLRAPRVGSVAPVVEHAIGASRVRGLVAGHELASKPEPCLKTALLILHGITFRKVVVGSDTTCTGDRPKVTGSYPACSPHMRRHD